MTELYYNTYNNLFEWLMKLEMESNPSLNETNIINYTITDLEDKILDYGFSDKKVAECNYVIEHLYKNNDLANIKENTLCVVMATIIIFFLYECYGEYAETSKEFMELCSQYNILEDKSIRNRVFLNIRYLEEKLANA